VIFGSDTVRHAPPVIAPTPPPPPASSTMFTPSSFHIFSNDEEAEGCNACKI